MEEGLRAYIFFSLFVSSTAWPRYGRPHPLYNGSLQTNENLLANAILLGLDFNDLQVLGAASGDIFGLMNFGLPENGFPVNAYARKRARQYVNTLTALGIIDGPEEAGLYLSLIGSNKPDPPDIPGGRDGVEKNKKNTGKKTKVNRKSKVANKSKQIIVNGKTRAVNPKNRNNTKSRQDRKGVTVIKGRQGVVVKAKVNETKNTNIGEKAAEVIKTTVPKQNLATKVVKAKRKNSRKGDIEVNNRNGRKGGVTRSQKRKTKRQVDKNWERGDPGEGRLEGEMPLKARGKRVLWRSSRRNEAQIGRGKVLERRLIVGRF